VEVIVALTIFGTGIVAVFGAMRTCAAAAHHNRMLTGSVLLAESLLAETRLDENPAFQTKEGARNLYSWKVQLVPTPVENLAAVKVTVEWPEQKRVQAYELVSLVHIKSVMEGN
jgi:hypothetical protein